MRPPGWSERSTQEPPAVSGARWLPLTHGVFALVDESDWQTVSARKWQASGWTRNKVYAAAVIRENGHKRFMRLHRLLMGFPAGEIDHANGNTLDNRRSNLRICRRCDNERNKKRKGAGYKGTVWKNNKWYARIWQNGKHLVLGTFSNQEEAAHCYDNAARRLFGAFACVNFPVAAERGALEALRAHGPRRKR